VRRRAAVIVLVSMISSATALAESVRRVVPAPHDGSSLAVVVADAPLVFTTQLLPLNGDGQPLGADAAAQATSLLDALETGLGPGAAARLVKLNFAAASDQEADQIRSILSARYPANERPAAAFVSGALPRADIRVALDAIAIDAEPAETRISRRSVAPLAALAVNPGAPQLTRAGPGSLVFVSGQAEQGANLSEATRNTLRSLASTLDHLGLSFADVVQVRSFLSPMAEIGAARDEISQVFSGPQVYVEWLSPGAIEIELLAVAPAPAVAAGNPVEFITPPGMQPSPVFCRVTRTHGRSLIFIAGLHGTSSQSSAAEVTEIFGELDQILKQTGSDLRHLAKATYYVANDDASLKLNELRPRYYDPQRPPAASKAPVTGAGRPGKTLTIDMIAVPTPRE